MKLRNSERRVSDLESRVLCIDMLKCLRANLLLIATIASVLLAIMVGLLCRLLRPTSDTIMLVEFPGEIFMRMLKMMMIPLLVSSMITGIAGMDTKSAGRMGLFTLIYYISTTVIAITVGLSLVFAIKPGAGGPIATNHKTEVKKTPTSLDIFMDLMRNLVPDNIVGAAVEQSRTVYKNEGVQEVNTTMHTNLTETVHWTKQVIKSPGLNAVGILGYCVVFGLILGKLGNKGKVMLNFFIILNTITMKMVRLIMWLSPVGIFFLITSKILSVHDLSSTAQRLGLYIVTNLLGLFIHSVVVVPLIYVILTRKNPYRVTLGIVQALLTMLGINSSAGTLPVTLRCCEEKLKFDKSITRFVLPIGATVNMDGGAIFFATTTVFVAQLSGKALGFGNVLTLGLSACLASVGVVGIPGADFLVVLILLSILGLPLQNVYPILAVDWLLGRMRGLTNISGDCMAAGVLHHFFGKKYDPSNTCQAEDETDETDLSIH